MKSILTLAAALTLALSACTRQAAPEPEVDPAPAPADAPPATQAAVPPPAAAEPSPPTDARFDGYGDLRFGMTADEARQAWGGELVGVAAEGEGCYHLNPKWVQTPAEFALMFEGGRLVRYSTESDKLVAPGGGMRGMDTADIQRLYAGRVEERPHKYTDGQYLRIEEAGAGGGGALVFETDPAGKVTEWRVGVPPQVDYVEGCS